MNRIYKKSSQYALLICCCCIALINNKANAQRVYADDYASTSSNSGVASASVDNPQFATDADHTNSATLKATVVLLGSATATIELKFLNGSNNPMLPVPAGTKVYIQYAGSLPATFLLLFGGSSGITAYQNATNASHTAISGSVVSSTAGTFSNTIGNFISIVSSGSFNASYIQVNPVSIGLGSYSIGIYYAFYVAPPIVPNQTICTGGSATITPTPEPNIGFRYYTDSTGGTLLGSGASYTTPALTNTTTYFVEARDSADITNFISLRKRVTVTVIPKPTLSSAATTTVCSGVPVNYMPTSASTATPITYGWSRAAVANISNVPASGSGSITEALINTSANPVNNVVYQYTITGTGSGCTNMQNVTVTVRPQPSGTLSATSPICEGEPTQLLFNATAGTAPYSLIINSTTYSNIQSNMPFNTVPDAIATTTYSLTQITDNNNCTNP